MEKTKQKNIIVAIIFFIALLAVFDGLSDAQNDKKAKTEQSKNIEKTIIQE